MGRLIAFKVLQAVPVILIVSILAFLLMSLLPGDPAVLIAGGPRHLRGRSAASACQTTANIRLTDA